MAPFVRGDFSPLASLKYAQRVVNQNGEKSRGCGLKGGTLLGIKHEQLAERNVIQEQEEEGMWRITDQGGNSRVNTL